MWCLLSSHIYVVSFFLICRRYWRRSDWSDYLSFNLLFLLPLPINNIYRMKQEYKSFEDFYPFYLSQHSDRTCRRLHFIGTLLAALQLIRTILFSFNLINLLLVLVIGYGFAWIGHFVFEKNKPATFKYPWFSFKGDMRLFYEIGTGARAFWMIIHRPIKLNNKIYLKLHIDYCWCESFLIIYLSE